MLRLFLFGRRGSGKSTVARFLAECTGAKVYKISEPLYRVARDVFGMEDRDRRLLQLLGDKFREVDPDCLLRCLSLALYRDGPQAAVVEDVRLAREADWLRRMGFQGVLVRAPEPVRLARLEKRGERSDADAEEHVTECGVKGITPDYVLETGGSFKDVRNAVRALVGEIVYRQVASSRRCGPATVEAREVVCR
ncbi:MAG: AAA family ATPase [Bacillota bacterium]|nr:AAA family ATPase [Bacillota bacterium]